ncbi:MAG: SDR family oxidoreductase [Rhizobiaceae bacterium]
MSVSVAGKVMIVTGASSGIGRAVARQFSAAGALVVLVARSAEKLEALAAELGANAIAMPADLTKPAQIDAMAAAVEARFGRVDILFANAGTYIPGEAAEGNADDWDQMINLNVNGVFRMVRAVLPGMIARRSGDIVVTSSVSGHQAIHWEPVYSATKHAVQSFVHGVRRQIAPHNVRIGSLAPGMVLNELWGLTDPAEVARRAAAREGLLSEDVADALMFMVTRPPNATVRDLVILPQNQDI